MTDSRYLLDHDPEAGDLRLGVKERIQDPTTIEHLEAIGVAPGWSCLEVGAGRGSIADWLCRRVGPAGRVVATDADVKLLGRLDHAHLEVRRHDLATDGLERDAFDLVHAREVLVHVAQREAVLEKLAAAVKPGGWIFLEEPDVVTDAPDPGAPEPQRRLYAEVVDAIYGFLAGQGLDLHLGSRLPGLLHALGFESLRSEGRVRGFRGGAAGQVSPHMMAFAQLEEVVVAGGRVTAGEYREFLALRDDPGFAWREALLVSARGRRPA